VDGVVTGEERLSELDDAVDAEAVIDSSGSGAEDVRNDLEFILSARSILSSNLN
jgi:hypothetical protein